MDKYYRARVRARWGIDEVMLCGYTFQEAIKRFSKDCIESDDTGYFFDVADADISSMKGNEHIYYVDNQRGKYAIEVELFKEN